MRLTSVLCKQHIGTMFKRHWQIQGKRIAQPTGACEFLQEKGIPIVDAVDFALPKPQPIPEYEYFLIENK